MSSAAASASSEASNDIVVRRGAVALSAGAPLRRRPLGLEPPGRAGVDVVEDPLGPGGRGNG